jgi:hypothetical protein
VSCESFVPDWESPAEPVPVSVFVSVVEFEGVFEVLFSVSFGDDGDDGCAFTAID